MEREDDAPNSDDGSMVPAVCRGVAVEDREDGDLVNIRLVVNLII